VDGTPHEGFLLILPWCRGVDVEVFGALAPLTRISLPSRPAKLLVVDAAAKPSSSEDMSDML
jgi:hypothetical protein